MDRRREIGYPPEYEAYPHEDMGAEEFARKQRERDVLALRKRAAKLGFTLVAPDVIRGAA